MGQVDRDHHSVPAHHACSRGRKLPGLADSRGMVFFRALAALCRPNWRARPSRNSPKTPSPRRRALGQMVAFCATDCRSGLKARRTGGKNGSRCRFRDGRCSKTSSGRGRLTMPNAYRRSAPICSSSWDRFCSAPSPRLSKPGAGSQAERPDDASLASARHLFPQRLRDRAGLAVQVSSGGMRGRPMGAADKWPRSISEAGGQWNAMRCRTCSSGMTRRVVLRRANLSEASTANASAPATQDPLRRPA